MPDHSPRFLSVSDRIRVAAARDVLHGLAAYAGPHVPGFVVHLQHDPARPWADPGAAARFAASGYASVPALCVVFRRVLGRWEFVRIEYAAPAGQ
ncbi:hypothetical protein ACFQ48_15280 [Hymenobacter caeli]|uniref:Uncharacterized protein n=1 Tax=Hymenobacter caeli TaxID=2735894 RepID=A0ABX2FSS1_9BACT|nr:hypothetical protein [Hymenobacter caeli]NRT19430.1 hypothetical protein [Hymenobacter caeli]